MTWLPHQTPNGPLPGWCYAKRGESGQVFPYCEEDAFARKRLGEELRPVASPLTANQLGVLAGGCLDCGAELKEWNPNFQWIAGQRYWEDDQGDEVRR